MTAQAEAKLKTPPPSAAPALMGAPSSAAPPQAALPPALEALAEEVRGYADLPPGWEPYDGKTPTARAIENAIAFFALLPPGALVPHVVPRGDGGVGISWDQHRRKGGAHLGLSFRPDGSWGWFGEAPGLGETEPEEEDTPFHPEEGLPEGFRRCLDAVCLD